jgi:predicted alpha/beta-fold hydrolase
LLTHDLKLNPIRREVQLDDGDRLVMQDDCPDDWNDGDPVLLLLHGLSGSHMSAYMQRMAMKAKAQGIRAFRLDHRGSGAGKGLAKYTYHAGRSGDVRAVLDEIEHVCGDSAVSIASFSLSANVMLKLLGEAPDDVPKCIHRVAAVSPPVDLSACVRFLDVSTVGRIYDRNFAKWLIKQVKHSPQWREDVPLAQNMRAAKRVLDFDELYTAPAAGYRDAAHYYAEASAGPRVKNIKTPTLILISRDDPMIPFNLFEQLEVSSSVDLHVTDRGGHLGFYGTNGVDADRYWMDWRLLEWLFES